MAALQPAVKLTAYKSLSATAGRQFTTAQSMKAPGAEWLELDRSNAAKFLATQNSNILTSTLPNQWHQIIVKDPATDRFAVLTAINKQITPLKITPYFCGLDNGRLSFYVNSCGTEIQQLCRHNLVVPYKKENIEEIELLIKLCAKTFNFSESLQNIVSSRLDPEKKNLDLSYLIRIPLIREMVFNPIDITPLLEPIFRVAEVLAPGIVSLNLAGNNLKSLSALKSFFATSKPNTWKNLKILDLCHNEINFLGGIISPKARITELYLDDNPICAEFSKTTHYINIVKANFPGVVKLDGAYLQSIPNFPVWKPNYIISNTLGDAGEIVDQFLDHFFTLYDGDNRTWLRGMYHEVSYFSLACVYMGGQTTSSKARLTRYQSVSRNLLQSTEKRRERTNLICGEEQILDKLSNLPRSQHDPHTFTVDVTQNTEKCVVLTVTGVFRERSTAEKTSPRHFMRTFVLVKLEGNEFKIVNDIMYVSNATSKETEEAFTFSRPLKKIKKPRPNKPELTELAKESLIDMISQLTDMTPLWSRKCLEDCDWDMKESLQVFLELYKLSKIPKAAFVNPKLQTGRA